MKNIEFKNHLTLSSSDIENLVRRFGGNSNQYHEIVDKLKNNQTINKYTLLNEIHDTLNVSDQVGEDS
jgi:hypothetical protein